MQKKSDISCKSCTSQLHQIRKVVPISRKKPYSTRLSRSTTRYLKRPLKPKDARPLSNLDAALRVNMRLEITALHQELKTTMIYVTHDQVEAMTMADKIVVLQAGRVEQVGKPMDLYNSPANKFVAGSIDTASPWSSVRGSDIPAFAVQAKSDENQPGFPQSHY